MRRVLYFVALCTIAPASIRVIQALGITSVESVFTVAACVTCATILLVTKGLDK